MLCIILPQIDQWLHISKDIDENRTVQNTFVWNGIEKFPIEFTQYYDENFGFRASLIRQRARIFIQVFKESPNSSKAIFTRDGGMFYNDEADGILKDYTHTNLLSRSELMNHYRIYAERKKRLDSMGIKYYRTFIPNAQTIYPEKLKDRYALTIRGNTSRAQQIMTFFDSMDHSNPIIDHSKIFMEQKSKHKLYLDYDTHWTQWGAYFAYQNILQHLHRDFAHLHSRSMEKFKIEEREISGGDLVNMMGAKDFDLFKERASYFYPIDDSMQYQFVNAKNELIGSYTNPPTQEFGSIIQTINAKATNRLKLVVFRDSYGKAIIPFLSSQFYHVTYIWDAFKFNYVELAKPDLILESRVERYFYNREEHEMPRCVPTK